ncbi:MAG: hypothetical protein WC749_02070 [Dehalococcoidia bacterium]
MRNSLIRHGVSLRDYLEKIIDLKFEANEQQIKEAKRLMEKTMDGFPEQFLKTGDFGPVKAELRAISKVMDQMEGKASQKSMIVALTIAIISLLLAGFVAVAGLARHFAL